MNGKVTTLVIADGNEGKLFLASLVSVLTNGYLTHSERKVQISMREEGSEVLYGDDDIKAAMKASADAAEFTVKKCVQSPESIPDSVELAVRSEQTFCGRIRFTLDAQEQADSAIVIAGNNDISAIAGNIAIAGNVHFTVAVKKETAQESDIQARFGELVRNSAGVLGGSNISTLWYSPYGFMSDGTPRSEENASPMGIHEIFWDAALNAAQHRTDELSQIIADSERMIGLRAGAFQKNSPRRQLELNYSRSIYAKAAGEIFAAEQLAALAGGKPLAYDK